MGLFFKKTPRKLFRFYLSNWNERDKEDVNACSEFENYVPTIGVRVVHEDSRIGEVDLMLFGDDFPVSQEEMLNAFTKFGFVVKEVKIETVIEKSFLGFIKWS